MKLSAKLPPDDVGASLMRFDNVRSQRYTEIFLIGGHAITGHLVGGVYNTAGLNNPAGTGDSCPQAMLDKVDVDVLKKEYDVISAFKNGPRLWCLDWVEVMAGVERDFNGLKGGGSCGWMCPRRCASTKAWPTSRSTANGHAAGDQHGFARLHPRRPGRERVGDEVRESHRGP